MAEIKIGSEGVHKALAKYTPERAIAEYVWNGFDAKATKIEIIFSANEIGHIGEITIKDNGTGIDNTTLDKTFKPFYESEKAKLRAKKSQSEVHGMNGIGRLTFQSFANEAVWKTKYENDNGIVTEYALQVEKSTLNKYKIISEPKTVTKKATGTSLVLSQIFKLNEGDFEDKVRNYLIKDFCWYLELNKKRGFEILVNGKRLTYNEFLLDTEHKTITHKDTDTKFEISFYQWAGNLNEYSKYYFVGSDNEKRHKENTSFNNKGDNFFHSVIIKSSYFDNFDFNVDEDAKQMSFGALKAPTKRDKQYKFLKEKLNELLRDKRSPYLATSASQLIEDLENEKAIPMYDDNSPLETFKKSMLVETLKQLYVLEPKLFSNLNSEQKLTFTRFINLALESGGREHLFKIVDEVINLTADERVRLADILEDIRLDKIIKTVGMLDDRKKTIDDLRQIVYSKELEANEGHLQAIIEANTWIFGEEYNVTAAEDMGFDAALKKYRQQIEDKDTDKAKIDHDDRNRQMDVFITRKRVVSVDRDDPKIENIIIELKSPDVKLGKKELSQVEDYMRLIKNTDQFNSNTAKWAFLLVGNEFLVNRGEKRSYIEDKIEPNLEYGRDIAIFEKSNNYVIKVKTWSTIFDEFDIAHHFMYDTLLQEQKEIEKSQTKNVDEMTADIIDRETSKELDETFPHIAAKQRKLEKAARIQA